MFSKIIITIISICGLILLPAATHALVECDDNTTNSAMDIDCGGTNAATPTAARTNLGLAIGADVQDYSAELDALALLTTTAYGRALLEVADMSALYALFTTAWPVTKGGTAATTAAGARTSLGVAIGSDTQAWDADLDSLAALTYTAYGGALLELANEAALKALITTAWSIAQGGTGATSAAGARTAFGLVIGTNVQAYGSELDLLAALTSTAFGRDLLELADADALSALVTGVERVKCATPIENLVAADDNFMMGSLPHATTVLYAWCRYQGTGSTPAQISFEDSSGNAMTTSAALACIHETSTPSEGSGLETFTGGNTLIAYEGLRFDVDNTPDPATDSYEVCVAYEID